MKPIEDLSFTANYTYTKAEEGLALRIPESVFNAQLGYQFSERNFASLSFQQTSDREDIDFSTFENVTLDGYSVLDAYISHRFNKRLSAFLTLENIANSDYLEIFDFTTRGRNFRLGLQLSL